MTPEDAAHTPRDRFAWPDPATPEPALLALREELRGHRDPGPVATAVVAFVRDTFDPAFVTLWTDGHVVAEGFANVQAFAADHPLAMALRSLRRPHRLDDLDARSEAVEALRGIGAVVVAPLHELDLFLGVLALGPRPDGSGYVEHDLVLLDGACRLAAAALCAAEVTTLRATVARLREASAEEAHLARTIQRSLLPRDLPTMPGWRVTAHYQPAQVVGGDLYDFIALPGDRLGILLGDVSDKSVPAALMMAAARTLLRATGQRLHHPGQVLQRVNDALCDQLPEGMFVTCFFGVLDPESGRVRFANSGHFPPKLRTGEGVTELRATGWPLGMMPGVTYQEGEAVIPPGGTLVLYSDGLTESHAPDGAMFGADRLAQTLATAGDTPPLEAILAAHRAFAGPDALQEDDLTLVAVERLPVPATALPAPGPDRRTLLEFDVPSEPGIERAAGERVVAAVDALPLTDRQRDRLMTAVAESVMNAAEHGNGYRPEATVRVRVELRGEELLVSIADEGESGDIPAFTAPDIEAKLAGLQSPRGWGLFLIKEMVDSVRTESTSDGHLLELTVNLGAQDAGNGSD